MAEQKGLPHMQSKAQTLAELEKKRKELTAQIEAGRADALAEIVATAIGQATQIGISVAELVQAFGKGGKHGAKVEGGKGSRSPAPAKYRNPKNQAEVWSGRGRKPKWLVDAETAGITLESLLIEPAPAKN